MKPEVEAYHEIYAPNAEGTDEVDVEYYTGPIAGEVNVGDVEAYKEHVMDVFHIIEILWDINYNDDFAYEQAVQLGSMFDFNQDERIDVNEFQVLASELSHLIKFPITDNQVLAAFHLADINDSNDLDIHEGVGLLQFIAGELAIALEDQVYGTYYHFWETIDRIDFELTDWDVVSSAVSEWLGDREEVSFDEFIEGVNFAVEHGDIPLNPDDADMLFEYFDYDYSGTLSLEEIVDGFIEAMYHVRDEMQEMVDAFHEAWDDYYHYDEYED